MHGKKHTADRDPSSSSQHYPKKSIPLPALETPINAALETLFAAAPFLRDKISERDLIGSPSGINDRIAYFLHSLSYLIEKNDNAAHTIIKPENMLKLLASDTFFSWEFYSMVTEIKFNSVRQIFVDKFFEHFDEEVHWKPLIEEINSYNMESQLAMITGDAGIESYVRRFAEKAATCDYCSSRLGLPAYLAMLTGLELSAQIGDERNSFYTTPDGIVYYPAYVDHFGTKEENFLDFMISSIHECGHHLWNSFEINCNPSALNYRSMGLVYVEYSKDTGVLTVRQKGQRKKHHLRKLHELFQLFEFPKLLQSLHNILDDERVDRKNMETFAGIADDYAKNIKQWLTHKNNVSDSKKPESKMAEFSLVLDAILEYAYFKKTDLKFSEAMEAKWKAIKKIIDKPAEDGSTTSLNKSVLIYNILLDDAKEIAAEVAAMDVRTGRLNSVTYQKGNVSFVSEDDTNDSNGTGIGVTDGQVPVLNGNGSKGESNLPIFAYDESTSDGKRKSQHRIIEIPVKGTPIRVSPSEKQRIFQIFSRYAPKQGVMVIGEEGDDIDEDRFNEWRSDLLAGRLRVPDYLSRLVYEKRNVATAVLIDLSRSMEPVLPNVLEATALLSEASMLLRDPLFVAGLSHSTDSQLTEFHMMKRFSDPTVSLASVCGGFTPLAGPMRHLTKIMTAAPEARAKKLKQVFVLTDAGANVGEEPLEDMRVAIASARNVYGINTFMVGFATDEKSKKIVTANMEKMVAPEHFLVLLNSQIARLSSFFESYYRKHVKR